MKGEMGEARAKQIEKQIMTYRKIVDILISIDKRRKANEAIQSPMPKMQNLPVL